MPRGSAHKPPASSADDVADELYGLPPEEFTAARNRSEKQARDDGDRELAAAIHRLKKPTATAWLANQLIREHPDEVRPLMELGAGLRQATKDLAGDDLRRLSEQRHELVYALVKQARRFARATGHSVSESTARGLADTLHAALADEHAADQLLRGRLTEGLQHVGFLDSDTEAPSPAPQPAPSHPPSARDRLRRAENDLDHAEQELRDAIHTRDQAAEQASKATKQARSRRGRVDELRRELADAENAADDAERLERDRAAAARQADRAANDAERRRDAARARRDRLRADA